MKKIAASIAAAWLVAAPADANDSTAETAAGGLVLTRTDAIDMVSEDLFVSAEQVRVRYVFRNRTAKAIRTTVAFPLPEVSLAEREYRDIAVPHDFVTVIDGKPVRMAVERKAMLAGKDHTALLASLKVPLSDDAGAAIDRLSKADRARLVAAKLAIPDDYRGEPHLAPGWTVKETYHWEQVFPAGRDLIVEHRYVPGTGGSVGTALVLPDVRNGAEGKAYAERYCTDATFLSGVDRLARGAGNAEAALPEYRIGYVLKTGANWRAPIGRFRLVVDKGAAANLVSFCGEGVRKISPTQFEVRHQDWRPVRDLDILIVAPRS